MIMDLDLLGCPAHDQRDFDFAKKYNLEIKTVVRPMIKIKILKYLLRLTQDLVL